MHIVNIHKAKNWLSQLVDTAGQGEEIVITKKGKPVARLCALTKKSKRKPGLFKGKMWIADDFDAPLSNDILDAFEEK